MPEWASTTIVVIVILLVFFGMWWGWRARSRRDAGLTPLYAAPAPLGATVADADVFYVATTERDRPLERLAVRGLGFRARALLTVHEAGAVLAIPGEREVVIPASDVEGVKNATVTIDRVVEKDGLIALSWKLDGTPVDSYFRTVQPADQPAVSRAIQNFIPDAESEV